MIIAPITPEELAEAFPERVPGGLQSPAGDLPLTDVAITGRVSALNATITVRQAFRNTYDAPLEVTYVFPLPDRFAVAGMVARLGDRDVTATLKERAEARQQYADAIAAGNRAAMVEQERAEVFTATLGNIAPGEHATITMHLTGRLAVDSGEATLRFPLTFGDRYVPGRALDSAPSGDGGAPDTDQVPDASRISPPRMATSDKRAPSLEVDIAVDPAGLLGSDLRTTDQILVETPAGVPAGERSRGWRLRVRPGTVPTHDLIARFGIVERDVQAVGLITTDSDDDTAGTWQLIVSPPTAELQQRTPRSLTILLDRSGSMGGWQVVAARMAAARIVESLTDTDEVSVLAFDHTIEMPPGRHGLTRATDSRRRELAEWLNQICAKGGTEMYPALKVAFDQHELANNRPDGRDHAVVLITDGEVGNEQAMIQLAAEAAHVRLYTIGIGVSANQGMLAQIAAVGGGRHDVAETQAELDRALLDVHRRIGAPLVESLAVSVTAGAVRISRDDTAPRGLDLFPSGPAVLSGRWTSAEPVDLAEVRLSAFGQRVDGTRTGGADGDEGSDGDDEVAEWPVTMTVLPTSAGADQADALRTTWARWRLSELEGAWDAGRTWDGTSSVGEAGIVEFSLAHTVLSRFTAWVAVGPGGVEGEQVQVSQPTMIETDAVLTGGFTPMGYAAAGGPAGVVPNLDGLPPAPRSAGRPRFGSMPSRGGRRPDGVGKLFRPLSRRAPAAGESYADLQEPAFEKRSDGLGSGAAAADVTADRLTSMLETLLARLGTVDETEFARLVAEFKHQAGDDLPDQIADLLDRLPAGLSELQTEWWAHFNRHLTTP